MSVLERALLGVTAVALAKIGDDETGWRESCLHLTTTALNLSVVHAEAFEPLLQVSPQHTASTLPLEGCKALARLPTSGQLVLPPAAKRR
jgi:hypothetical protein